MDSTSMAPRLMSLHLLEEITNGFSNDRKVGSGSYGSVYKGKHKNGETVAVKLLHYIPGHDDEKYMEEYLNVASLQHKNIVRLVGYCHETRREVQPFGGRMVLAEVTKRALCFEYMHNGSLDQYLSDEFTGHDWRTRYAIIKGICQGLKYLHEELQPPMYHLDLKPANVLLDENMVPKLADFGLSRLFGGEQTQMTTSSIGTFGYIPPEFINSGIVSNKFDVFSLGVVFIKIMTGPKGYYRSAEMSAKEFTEIVHVNWSKRLHAASVHLLDSYSEQVKRCIEIALSCVDVDRYIRPTIGLIISKLNETETMYKLENVRTRGEACGAKLRDKEELEMLRFAWTHTVSQDKYDSCMTSENLLNIVDISNELSLMDDCGPSNRPYMDTAKEVLEGLEPHMDLKDLHISGYTETTAPAWLASNIAHRSLQTLHLEYCAELQILPSFEGLPFLTKLKLKNLQKVIEAVVPALEDLLLIGMPMLERCSSTSRRDLNYSLRILKIKRCPALKVFDLFENDPALEIQQNSLFPGLRKLIIRDCPQLEVQIPLPPSTTVSELFISGVSTLPAMDGSVSDTLTVGTYDDDFDKVCDEMVTLDDKILAFHYLRVLKTMRIFRCPNLEYISVIGLRELISLECLEINNCQMLFSSEVLLDHACEELTRASCHVFPSLLRLSIVSCGISGRLLSMILRHAPALEELVLSHCPQFTQLSIEDGENNEPSLFSAAQASSSVYQDNGMSRSAVVGLLRIPFHRISCMKNIVIIRCPGLIFNGRNDGFAGLTFLEKLEIWGCPHPIFNDNNEGFGGLPTHESFVGFPSNTILVDTSEGNAGLPSHEELESCDFAELLSYLFDEDENCDKSNGRLLLPPSLGELHISKYSSEMLQLCFPSELTYLRKLRLSESPSFKSLQLHSCTALEELNISNCKSLALEGLQSLGSLRYLKVEMSPSLAPSLERLSGQDHQLFPRLEKLEIDDPFVLTRSFCKHLTSLRRLELVENKETSLRRLTDEQESSLLLLRSLQELQFRYCKNLIALPMGLHSLRSLKRLHVLNCGSLSRLPEMGLPPSLEELDIGNFYGCSQLLIEQCRMRATRKLKVKIGLRYIN